MLESPVVTHYKARDFHDGRYSPMSSEADYTIDRVDWHTSVDGNPESRERIHARFLAIAEFLRNNNLVSREILPAGKAIDDSFQIRSSDLTEEGLSLIKRAYDRWLGRIDRGQNPADVTWLARELRKLRSGPA